MKKQHVTKANDNAIANTIALKSDDMIKSIELQEIKSMRKDLQAKIDNISLFWRVHL